MPRPLAIGRDLATRAVRGLLRRLPERVAVGAVAGSERVGVLDHPRFEIPLTMPSLVAMARRNACSKEPETVAWIESRIASGDSFYDIGANVGAYSLVAWHAAGRQCTVHAFEPSATTFQALVRNIELNRAQHAIVPLPVALGPRCRVEILDRRDPRAGAADHRLVEPTDRDLGAYRQAAMCFALDELIGILRLPPPTLIKIDVDGGESGVIAGAAQTLQDPALRSVLIEVDESRADFATIGKGLEAAGFEPSERHRRPGQEYLFNCIYHRRK